MDDARDAREGAREAPPVHPQVGYPDTWRDYSGLAIDRDDLVGDIEQATCSTGTTADRIDQPVDRNEWDMTPPTVNAYYKPTLN